jgi:hypothetical protein
LRGLRRLLGLAGGEEEDEEQDEGEGFHHIIPYCVPLVSYLPGFRR